MNEYIYSITSKSTGKIYIGRSWNPRERFNNHLSCLRRKEHTSSKLQSIFDSFGEDDLEFRVIDSGSQEEIFDLEEFWILEVHEDLSLNMISKSTGGRKLMPEQRKIRAQRYLEILDFGFRTGIGLNKLAKQFKVSSGVLTEYKPEWEQESGVKYEHPQIKDTLLRLYKFVEDLLKDKDRTLSNLESYKISHKSFSKYLPEFGLSLKDIYRDGWKNEAVTKAQQAVDYRIETKCSASEAIRKFGASATTFYKLWKEQNIKQKGQP